MSSSRMVRGTKSRFILYVCAALALCGLTFLFHNSQTQLDETKKAMAACTQQQESLSAQLQVIFEYKLRLEKSLQKEKTDHKETKDECQDKAHEEKLQREKEGIEALNKYNALQQHYKLLQSTHKDQTEECDKIRKTQLEKVDEASKLENQVQSLTQELQLVKDEANKSLETYKIKFNELLEEKKELEKDNARLKEKSEPDSIRVQNLETSNKQLEDEVAQLKAALENCRAGSAKEGDYEGRPKELGQDVLPAPAQGGANNEVAVVAEPPKIVTGSSTTPVINPDAVMDHDDPLRQGQKEGHNKASTAASALIANKPTQEAAPPLVIPDNQEGGAMPDVPPNQENTHQLAPPDSIPQNKPAIPVGPMNPVQGVPDIEFDAKRNNLDGNNAEEEDPQRNNEIPRPHDYKGGDYDKEDDEGEQLDYDDKQHLPQIQNQPLQSRHLNRQRGSVMVMPK